MEKQPSLTKKNSKPQEQLEDLLTCQICYTLAKNILMCPHCSKIYCETCIKKSLFIKSQCPHCRKNIKDLDSMANCQRFVNEIKGIVEEVLREKQKENFKCESHGVPLNYFCLQCERSVCCQCKMFGDHKEHQLVQVEKKHQQKYQKIRSILTLLKVSVKQRQQLIGKMQNLLTEKNNYLRQEIANVNSLQKSCQEWQAKKRQAKKEEQKQSTQMLESFLEKINEMRKNLRSEYSRLKKEGKYSFSEFKQKRIANSVFDFILETQKAEKKYLKTKSHLKELIPAYSYQSFKIQNFSKFQGEAKCVIYSEPVQIQGSWWRLKIYPNGSESVQSKYLSIYVMMVQNQGWKTSSVVKEQNDTKNQLNFYEYFIQICSEDLIQISSEDYFNNENDTLRSKQSPNQQLLNGLKVEGIFLSRKKLTREYSSTFEPGQSWGYIKFIELKQLQAGGYLKHDILRINYSIRKPDYYKSYKTLRTQLHSIEQNVHSIQQLSNSKILSQTILYETLKEGFSINKIS